MLGALRGWGNVKPCIYFEVLVLRSNYNRLKGVFTDVAGGSDLLKEKGSPAAEQKLGPAADHEPH